MFLGHFGVALAAKKVAPRTSLGTLVMAAQFVDLIWPVFLLLGLERVIIAPGTTAVTPLDFISYPLSHSLLADVGWACLFAGIYKLVRNDTRGAICLWFVLLSHWFLDALSHQPDLPLYPGSTRYIGLGLWNSVFWTLVVEGAIFILGAKIYARATHPRDRIGTFAFRAFVTALVLIYLINVFGPPPPSEFPPLPTKTGHTRFPIPGVDLGPILPWVPLIVAGVALVVVFTLLWIYIASVYRFVLFDSVLFDRCELKGSWRRWERYGRSYFFWCLALFAAFWAGEALLIAAPLAIAWRLGLFQHPIDHLAVLIPGGLLLLAVLLIFMVLGGVAVLFAKDFCIPIMALENVGVVSAWRRLFPLLAGEKTSFAAYVLMKIVLAIGSAILFGMIIMVSLIVVTIFVGIAALIFYFGGRALGLTLNLATVSVLIVLATAIVAGVFYIIAVISTPPMVFFQSYALHFFGSRYPRLGEILFPPAPEAPPPFPIAT